MHCNLSRASLEAFPLKHLAAVICCSAEWTDVKVLSPDLNSFSFNFCSAMQCNDQWVYPFHSNNPMNNALYHLIFKTMWVNLWLFLKPSIPQIPSCFQYFELLFLLYLLVTVVCFNFHASVYWIPSFCSCIMFFTRTLFLVSIINLYTQQSTLSCRLTALDHNMQLLSQICYIKTNCPFYALQCILCTQNMWLVQSICAFFLKMGFNSARFHFCRPQGSASGKH